MLIKHFCYCFISLVLLIILIPLFLVIGCVLLNKNESILFTQYRLGIQRNPFLIYKFRTMHNEQITLVGGFLRATGIDELPQLYNILKGDMSFVGPRPLTSADVNRLGWADHYYNIRWSVKPGITGLAQLSKQCHRKKTWLYDRYYVINSSICLDIKCIFRSILVPFLGKKWRM